MQEHRRTETDNMTKRTRPLLQNIIRLAMLIFMVYGSQAKAESASKGVDDATLIDDYINAQGKKEIIVFDASNIKQYWIDKSVLAKNGEIIISLQQQNIQTWKSVPLKIQLANLLETQDCNIEVITSDRDVSYSILDNNNKVLSNSKENDGFIQYHIVSSVIHLEDTQDFSFSLMFSSKTSSINIKKIVLSFSENKNSFFAGSPGFEKLLKEIDEKGTPVPNYDIKYLVSTERNKIYFKIPNNMVASYSYFYHAVPRDKKDLAPDRAERNLDFNNHDFNAKTKHLMLPKPYSLKSDYAIIQRDLPSYQFSFINIGQFDSSKRLWTITVKPQ